MVKIPRHLKKKSDFYKKKYQMFKNPLNKVNVQNMRGRPKKVSIPIKIRYRLQDYLQKPSMLQTLDLFSEFPKILISSSKNKEESKTKYQLWFAAHPSPERFSENYNYPIHYPENNEKQKFWEFMTALMQRTADSMGLNSDFCEFLTNIKDNFCFYFEELNEELVQNKIFNHFYSNALMKSSFLIFFDDEIFGKIISVLYQWKNFFKTEFENEF
jgi:hypothetical protein